MEYMEFVVVSDHIITRRTLHTLDTVGNTPYKVYRMLELDSNFNLMMHQTRII